MHLDVPVIPTKPDLGKGVPTSVRIPAKILGQIDEEVARTGNSRNAIILIAIELLLAERARERAAEQH